MARTVRPLEGHGRGAGEHSPRAAAPLLALALALVLAPGLNATSLCFTDGRCVLTPSDLSRWCVDERDACVPPTLARNSSVVEAYWGDSPDVALLAFNRGARARAIDVVFAVDFTKSMADDLDQFINDWTRIVSTMGSKVGNRLRVSLIPFQDDIEHQLPGTDGNPVDVLTPFRDFSSNYSGGLEFFRSRLQLLRSRANATGGGGDCRENSYEAIRYAVEEDWAKDYEFGARPGACADGACAWRPAALRIIFVTTDAAVFTGRYDEMEGLGNAASARGIVVFGLTPDPSAGQDRSPCPPTCPPCRPMGKPCALTCVGSGMTRLCESACCGSDPSWSGTTGATCDPADPAPCSGFAWAPDTEREAYLRCFDLVNLTAVTRGRYFDRFDLGELSQTIATALDMLDYDQFTLRVDGPADLAAGIVDTVTGVPAVSAKMVLQGADRTGCTRTLEAVPCNALRRLELTVPDLTALGWYNYTLAMTATSGERQDLSLRVKVKAPVNASVAYAPFSIGDRLLVFVNVTNLSPHAPAGLQRGAAEVWCDSVRAGLLWEEGAMALPPRGSTFAVADCLAASRRSRGMRLAIVQVSPPSLGDTDPARLNVTLSIRDGQNAPLATLENEYLYTVRFNGADIGSKGVVYDRARGTYLLTVDIPAGTAKDGFNVLNVSVAEGPSSASDVRFVRWGNHRLELSSVVPFGNDARERLDDRARPARERTFDVARASLDTGARGLFVHQRASRSQPAWSVGPEMWVNYTSGRGFLVLQCFDRATGRLDAVVNRTGLLTGSLMRPFDAAFVQGHDIQLAVRSGAAAGGARVEPAFLVVNGALDVEGVGVQRREEGWRGTTYVHGVHYNNLTLFRAEPVPLSFAVTLNLTSVRLNVSSPALNGTQRLTVDPKGLLRGDLWANLSSAPPGSVLAVRVPAQGSGELWVNLTTDHRDLYFVRVPYRVTEPFALSAPENLTIVPNKTGEFTLRVRNLRFEPDTLRICGSGTGVTARVGGVEVTARPAKGAPACLDAYVAGDGSAEVNVSVRLASEAGGELALNATSLGDARLSRSARIRILPSGFTSSVIQLKGCEKSEWDLRCSFEFNNGGNVRNTYRFGFASDLLVVKPAFDALDVDAKSSKSRFLEARLIGCTIDKDLAPRLLALGRLHFLGRLFAENGNYSSRGSLADLFAEAESLARSADDLGAGADGAALGDAISRFLSAPGPATGAALARAVEAVSTAVFNARRDSCTLSRAKEITVTVFACDTPMLLKDEMRYACTNRTFRVSNIRIRLDYEVVPEDSLAATLRDTGALNVLAGEKATFAMVIRNKLHFPLLFDMIASSSDVDRPMAEEKGVLIEERKEHRFTVPVVQASPGRLVIHVKASPSGYPEELKSLPVPVEVDEDVTYDMEVAAASREVAVAAGSTAQLVFTITNRGNRAETFVVSVDGDAAVFSPPAAARPLIPAGGTANVTVTARAQQRGNNTCALQVRHGAKEDLVRSASITLSVLGPEFSVTVPEPFEVGSAIRIENLGTAAGVLDLSLSGGTGCASLANATVEVPAGRTVEVGILGACPGEEMLELVVEGAGYSRTLPVTFRPPAATAEPTALATPAPEPEPGPPGLGVPALALGAAVVVAAALAASRMRRRAAPAPGPARPGMAGYGMGRGYQPPQQAFMRGPAYPPRR